MEGRKCAWNYKVCCVFSIGLNFLFLWSWPKPLVCHCSPGLLDSRIALENSSELLQFPSNIAQQMNGERKTYAYTPKNGEDVVLWESFDNDKFYSAERFSNVCEFFSLCLNIDLISIDAFEANFFSGCKFRNQQALRIY